MDVDAAALSRQIKVFLFVRVIGACRCSIKSVTVHPEELSRFIEYIERRLRDGSRSFRPDVEEQIAASAPDQMCIRDRFCMPSDNAAKKHGMRSNSLGRVNDMRAYSVPLMSRK